MILLYFFIESREKYYNNAGRHVKLFHSQGVLKIN